MTNRNKNDKAHRYRKSRNIYAAAAAAAYIAGGLLAVAARTRAGLVAVSILAGLVTLVFVSLAVLYGRGARAAARRAAARAFQEPASDSAVDGAVY
jgi:hypothetical protein